MPLNEDAEQQMRRNFEDLKNGKRARLIVIGNFTETQLDKINTTRAAHKFPPLVAEIMFVGRHAYESRVVRDGYTIDDLIIQIKSAFSDNSTLLLSPVTTALTNQKKRDDGYGQKVMDRAVFECSGRHPNAELISVVPLGDKRKRGKKK
jgi:hypothetical protein